MFRHLLQAGCISVAAAAGLAGCGGSSGTDAAAATGNATFALSDAAVDGVTAVNITVTGLELKPANGSVQTITFKQPKQLNLLDLQNGKTANLILKKPLPAGEYNWVRLDLDTSNQTIKTAAGGVQNLTIPSGAETGLKLVHGFTVPSGGNVNFTLDFSLRKSLVEANGKYMLKPTLRIVDDSAAGEITGSVDYGTLSQQQTCSTQSGYYGVVYLYSGANAKEGDLGSSDEPYLTAPVSYNGQAYSYTLAHVPAGDYSLAYTCGMDDTSVDDNLSFVSAGNVTVTKNQTSTVNIQ